MSSSFQKTSEFSEGDDYSSVDVEYGKGKGKSPLLNDMNDTATEVFGPEEAKPLSLNPVVWYKDIKEEITTFTWEFTESKRVLMRAVFGEGLVTFLFLFTVMAASVNNGRQENPENLVLGAICTAFCAVAYIYSFADVSGAHFNPAVTFATIVTGKVSVKKGLAYIGIQIIASILATLHVINVFPKDTFSKMSVTEALLVKRDTNTQLVHAFFMESTLSFILVYVIFATAFDTVDTSNAVKLDGGNEVGKKLTIYTTSGSSKAGFAPLAIGFTLGFLGLLGGSVSGGCFNPARAFGPALLADYWQDQWVYWVADFVGAGLAGFAQSFFAHKPVHGSASVATKGARMAMVKK